MAKGFPYEDIVHLPPHISKKYPQPSMEDRAARFAPFAAVTGYEDMVLEEARVTVDKAELDESMLERLDAALLHLQEHLDEKPKVRITYYEPDSKKAGGSYQTVTGMVRRIDSYKRQIVLWDGKILSLDDISDFTEC